MSSYASSVQMAIEQVGESLVLRKKTVGTFDADTGAYTTTPTDSDTGFTGRVSRFKSGLINGTTVLNGDLQIMAVGLGSEPKPGDELIRNSRVFSILHVDPEIIADEVMYYQLHVRGV